MVKELSWLPSFDPWVYVFKKSNKEVGKKKPVSSRSHFKTNFLTLVKLPVFKTSEMYNSDNIW